MQNFLISTYSRFINIITEIILHLISDFLKSQPVFFCFDDIIIVNFDTKFEDVSKLFDHAAHNDSHSLTSHCFVGAIPCVLIWHQDKYSLWLSVQNTVCNRKKKSKLIPAASIIHQIMTFLQRKNVILFYEN